MAPPGISPFPRRAAPRDGRALRDWLLGAGIALGTLAIGAAQSPALVRRPAQDDSIPVVRCVDGSVTRVTNFMLIFNDGTRRSRL
jgi:hypothetical protein